MARAWPPNRMSIIENRLASMMPAERITPNMASILVETEGRAARAYTPRFDWRTSSNPRAA